MAIGPKNSVVDPPLSFPALLAGVPYSPASCFCGSADQLRTFFLRLQVWQLSPADVWRDVRSESRYRFSRWSVNGFIALIAYEMSRFGVVDHYAEELQVTVCITLNSVRKETGRCLTLAPLVPQA
jgi:hypothetical protein